MLNLHQHHNRNNTHIIGMMPLDSLQCVGVNIQAYCYSTVDERVEKATFAPRLYHTFKNTIEMENKTVVQEIDGVFVLFENIRLGGTKHIQSKQSMPLNQSFVIIQTWRLESCRLNCFTCHSHILQTLNEALGVNFKPW